MAWSVPMVAAGTAALLAGGSGGDSYRFVAAGRTLLSRHWSYAFASKYIQAGPLLLGLFGSIGHSGMALAVVLGVTAMALLLATAETLGVRNPAVLGALGLLAVAIGFTRVGYAWGHPEYGLLPLVWTLAAVYARRGHIGRAGLLVGLSAALATWGVLGIAVFALGPRWRDAGRGALVASAVAGLFFLPFVLGGHFAMGAYSWPVRHPSFLSLFVAPGTAFGWPLRLLQGAAAVGAGIAAARLLRQSPHALWIVPLTVVAARLLLDPLFLTYYRAAVEGPVLVGTALLASRATAFSRRPQESFA
jgi:hypothetical protein